MLHEERDEARTVRQQMHLRYHRIIVSFYPFSRGDARV
jgi:hypothetical protein